MEAYLSANAVTGHKLDLHGSTATVPYNPERQGWALPGGGSTSYRPLAEKVLVKLDAIMRMSVPVGTCRRCLIRTPHSHI